MQYQQGDIVIIPFPFSDLKGSKSRPAIVVSNKEVNESNDLILAQITTTLRNDKFSFTLDAKSLSVNLKPSEVRCHKIFTADKIIIKGKVSSLKESKRKELFEKILGFLRP